MNVTCISIFISLTNKLTIILIDRNKMIKISSDNIIFLKKKIVKHRTVMINMQKLHLSNPKKKV